MPAITHAHASTPSLERHLRAARVTRVDRGAVDVLTSTDGDELQPARVRTTFHDQVAVGDWVATADAVVDVVLTRRTAIRRAASNGRSEAQLLAANVDVVLVVVPAFPEPRIGMVERLVALAWDSGAMPVVVMTKTDLAADPDGVRSDLAEAAPGVDVIAVSAVSGEGIERLTELLAPGRTLCLLGRSGAGKSTLANLLLGGEVMATGDVRRDGKGRHTTTHRELLPLPGGAVLLDTPGLRGAGLYVSDDGLDKTFADVEQFLGSCRFTDCAHESEPGCAVQEALADGSLSERRYQSWRKLQREAAWMARRGDARLAAAARREWKQIHAEVRRSGRTRP
jgi:ribosome biogenesis GTPase